MLSTAYVGLFWVCEIAKSPYNNHVVKAADVHIGTNKNQIMFVLHTSKTHWSDTKPQIIKISSMEFTGDGKKVKKLKKKGNDQIMGLAFCPFELLKDFVNCRGRRRDDSEQFFVFSDGSPVTTNNFRLLLKSVLEHLGLDAHLYSGISLRSGRAGDLVDDLKFSIETVKKLGRWKSNAVFTFIRS